MNWPIYRWLFLLCILIFVLKGKVFRCYWDRKSMTHFANLAYKEVKSTDNLKWPVHCLNESLWAYESRKAAKCELMVVRG